MSRVLKVTQTRGSNPNRPYAGQRSAQVDLIAARARFIDPPEARGSKSLLGSPGVFKLCFSDWTCAAGANELAASEFLAALLSFGMGAEAAKSFARDREDYDFVLPNFLDYRPGPIAVAAFRLFSGSAEHEGDSSDGGAAGCSHRCST